MDLLEHMNAVLELTEESLDKERLVEPAPDCDESVRAQLLKTKAEMAFTQDDHNLKKEVAILHGKEMP